MNERISYESRVFALFVTLLCALTFAVGVVQGAEGDNSVIAPMAAAQPEQPEPMEFWPRRVSSEHTPEIYVQLSHPVQEPLATLNCEERQFDLGPPVFSHRQRLLHSFSLSPVPRGFEASCDLEVLTATGERFASRHIINIRAGEARARVHDVVPDCMAETGEGSLAVTGSRFTDLVNVVWISANEFRFLERSARVHDGAFGDSVVVPFSPLTSQAPPGEYLMVIENKNRSAAIYDGWFVISPAAEPEIESIEVIEAEGISHLVVSGFNLQGISTASLDLPAGQLPVAIQQNEGSLVPSIIITLPAFTGTGVKLSNISVNGDQLRIRISEDSELTQQ